MDKSSTWLPINDLESWDDYSFNQSAKWHCAQLESVDKIPCQGDFVLVGRESLTESLYDAFTDYDINNRGAGSFEFMKYKLWAELPTSDFSACHYGRLALEKNQNFGVKCSLTNPVIFLPPAPFFFIKIILVFRLLT